MPAGHPAARPCAGLLGPRIRPDVSLRRHHLRVPARVVRPADANGDARPLRTISGNRTGLTGNVITGIAVGPVTGDIYVMVKAAQFSGPGAVEVFGRFSNGNVPALRSFTDSSSKFQDAEGIAVAG
jgi:hypothetical protein